jgi:hypothetical protein
VSELRETVDALRQAVIMQEWDEQKATDDLLTSARWALVRWQLMRELDDAMNDVFGSRTMRPPPPPKAGK